MGWFVPWHGLDVLLHAIRRLDAAGLRIAALLVGEGPLRPRIEELAGTLGISRLLRFAGAVPFADVPAHMAACDAAVIPNTNDFGSPIKLFEYLGAGRAVVAPDLPQIAGVVRDGEEALLVPPGDAAALAQALARLAADPALRRRLGEAGRANVLRDHTWRRNAARVIAIAESLGRGGRR